MLQAIYHGHSFIQILDDHDNMNILIDPFIVWNTWCDVEVDDIIESEPTAVILTHGHSDHIWSTIEIMKETNALLICTYELGVYMHEKLGISLDRISSHGIGGSVEYAWYSVKFTPAIHGSGIWDMNHTYSAIPAGVLVTIWTYIIHHAWDTALTKDFELLADLDIFVSFVPIGDRYTMGVQDAIKAVAMIKPKYAVPIHFNTRPSLKVEPIDFARMVLQENHAIPKVLRPGQAVVAWD